MELPTDDELRQMIDDAVRQVETMMADFDMDEFIKQAAEYIDSALRDG